MNEDEKTSFPAERMRQLEVIPVIYILQIKFPRSVPSLFGKTRIGLALSDRQARLRAVASTPPPLPPSPEKTLAEIFHALSRVTG